MRPFKSFWVWTQNTSSSHAQGFFSPLLHLNFFALLTTSPSYLPHLISRLFHHHSLGELLSLSSSELQGDARHKAWGRWKVNIEGTWKGEGIEGTWKGEGIEGTWRGESKKNTSSQMQKWEKKGTLPPFFAFFFFFCLRIRQWLDGYHSLLSFFCFYFKHFFFLFFATNKATAASLLMSLNFFQFLLEAKKMTTTSLLPSHFFSSIVVTTNKATIVNMLPLPIFLLFLLEAKMGDNSNLTTITFFFLCYCCCKQGDSKKLIVVAHFLKIST